MQMPRIWFAAVNCRGVIYAIGGRCGKNTITNTVERYDAGENKWTYVSSMITERSSHAACVMNDEIYVVGGLDASGNNINLIERYNPQTDSWTVVGRTDKKLLCHSLVAL